MTHFMYRSDKWQVGQMVGRTNIAVGQMLGWTNVVGWTNVSRTNVGCTKVAALILSYLSYIGC